MGEKSEREAFNPKKKQKTKNSGYMYTEHQEKSHASLQTFLCVKTLEHTSNTAAAAKSLQSCPTLCDPIDGSLPGSPVPEILQARTPAWVAISFSDA